MLEDVGNDQLFILFMSSLEYKNIINLVYCLYEQFK